MYDDYPVESRQYTERLMKEAGLSTEMAIQKAEKKAFHAATLPIA
jgi:hypothetical protein